MLFQARHGRAQVPVQRRAVQDICAQRIEPFFQHADLASVMRGLCLQHTTRMAGDVAAPVAHTGSDRAQSDHPAHDVQIHGHTPGPQDAAT